VVRHEVEHLAEAVLPKGRDHGAEIRLVAQLGVQPAVVHDVVAM
jgi:hypothetical protein